jgi:hypothetical protein
MTVSRTAVEVDVKALERRYRWLMLAYPPGYRSLHGDELVATLLDTATPGRTLPPGREAWALIVGGLRARAGDAAEGSPWADGLHLGVTVLAVANLAVLLPYATSIPVWVALSAVAVVAVLRGRARVALPLVALIAGKVCAIVMGRPWLDRTLLPIFPDPIWGGEARSLYSSGGPLAPVAAYALVFLGLVVLAVRGRPLHTRSWGWWLAVPLIAGTDPSSWFAATAGSARGPVAVGMEVVLLGMAVWAGHLAADPRWAVAAGVPLLSALVVFAENASSYGRQELSHLGLLALLAVLAAAVPFHARRHALL